MGKEDKVVYFVRHGQSEGNITPAFQPLDSPLSELGKQQAKLIAERVSKISFERIISSNLTRAKETAEIISKLTDKEVQFSELFVERFKPTFLTGKPHSDEAALKQYREWSETLYTIGKRVEDGENFEDLMSRADSALEYLVDQQENRLVVVSHGFFLATIVARVLVGDKLTGEVFKEIHSKIEMENTGLTVLKYSQKHGWKLWIYNDHSHLG